MKSKNNNPNTDKVNSLVNGIGETLYNNMNLEGTTKAPRKNTNCSQYCKIPSIRHYFLPLNALKPKYAPTKPHILIYCVIRILSASANLSGKAKVNTVVTAIKRINTHAILRLLT